MSEADPILPVSTVAKTESNPGRPDRIDRLLHEWGVEKPEFDASSMAIVGRIVLLARIYEATVSEALAQFGLSYTDFDIIATIRRAGEPFTLSPTVLCDRVLLTSGGMTAALNRLENIGLIRRIQDFEDGRRRDAQLTKKGIALATECAAIRFALAEDSVSTLGQAEREILTGLLRKALEQVTTR